jgi:hypothetical protein
MTVNFTATFESVALEAKFRIHGGLTRSVVLSNLRSLEIAKDGKIVSDNDQIALVRFVEFGLRDNVLRYRSENGTSELYLLVGVDDIKMDHVFDVFIKALEDKSCTVVVEFGKEGEGKIDKDKGPKEYSLEYVNLIIRRNNGDVILKSFFESS